MCSYYNQFLLESEVLGFMLSHADEETLTQEL